MSNVKTIYLVANTSTKDQAGSNNAFELEITLNSGSVIDLDSDSDSRTAKYGSKDSSGDAATWIWDSSLFSENFTTDDVLSMVIDYGGNNAWLPASIFCIMEDTNGEYTLKSACGDWPADASFSTDLGDFGDTAAKERYIYKNGASSCGTKVG